MVRVLSRKRFMTGAAATVALPAVLRHSAMAAQFTLKLGHDIPVDHPLTSHLVTVAGKIKAATDGQVELLLFPNNQLGNDNHMLSQLRSGAMQMMAVGDNILAEFVPPAAIDNIAFAFKDFGYRLCRRGRWGRRTGARRDREDRAAPDGENVGTGFSPDDHRHQTD